MRIQSSFSREKKFKGSLPVLAINQHQMGGWRWQSSSHPLWCFQTLFDAKECWNLSSAWTSTEALPSVVSSHIISLHVFPECGWEELEPVHGLLLLPKPHMKSVCLSSNAQGGARLLQNPLAFGAGSHSSHRGTFVHEWMPNFSC